MGDREADRADILRLHKEWWESNEHLDIPRMAACFPTGMNYLMFNLNGHPYYGIEEKSQLWEHLRKQTFDYRMKRVQIVKLEIQENMAWLACESNNVRTNEKAETTEDLRVRATEVYQRDDGEGDPVWRMWHFHCSYMPPADTPRVGFDDTANQRGLGYSPWESDLAVVTGSE